MLNPESWIILSWVKNRNPSTDIGKQRRRCRQMWTVIISFRNLIKPFRSGWRSRTGKNREKIFAFTDFLVVRISPRLQLFFRSYSTRINKSFTLQQGKKFVCRKHFTLWNCSRQSLRSMQKKRFKSLEIKTKTNSTNSWIPQLEGWQKALENVRQLEEKRLDSWCAGDLRGRVVSGRLKVLIIFCQMR